MFIKVTNHNSNDMKTNLIYKEILLSVEYDYHKEQMEIRYPNDKAQPGEPAHVEIHNIFIEHIDISNLLEDNIEEIQSLILSENHEN